MRNVDRTVKDLQAQIERREKSQQILADDLSKSRDKIERLLSTIDELQASDSSSQLAAKRSERELREEREKSLRLEREVEGWKSMRLERPASIARSGTFAAYSDDARSRRGSPAPPASRLGGSINGDVTIEVPQRRSSLRKTSETKGFL